MIGLSLGMALLACADPPGREVDAPPFARAVRGEGGDPPVAPVAPTVSLEPGPDLVGLCDASGAVALGSRLVVADDEHNALRVFDWAAGGAPLPPIDLAALSPLFADGEADLEGMAAMPDGTVWITGSHDAGKGKERKPARQRLVAVRFADDATSATLAHGPTTGLIDQGQRQSQLYGIVVNTVGRPAKDPGGLSIEGLAAGPDGSLLFGFRAPIHGERALVQRLDNPVAFADGTAPPSFTGPRWLDLGGRGIRSLEAEPPGYLLIAGAAADSGPSSGLYRWRSFDEDAPEPIPVAFGDLNPEALVRIDDAWWVLSDDGGRDIGHGDCKKLPADQRRARTAKLVGLP